MTVLLLKLAGPLQSWGSESRFTERGTRHEPTKSGAIGLLAAALGRRRTDSVDDLASLEFGVRIDQPGTFEEDFQPSIGGHGIRIELAGWLMHQRVSLLRAGIISPMRCLLLLLRAIASFCMRARRRLILRCFHYFLAGGLVRPHVGCCWGFWKMNLLGALKKHPWEASRRCQASWKQRDKEFVDLEVLYDGLFVNCRRGLRRRAARCSRELLSGAS